MGWAQYCPAFAPYAQALGSELALPLVLSDQEQALVEELASVFKGRRADRVGVDVNVVVDLVVDGDGDGDGDGSAAQLGQRRHRRCSRSHERLVQSLQVQTR